jgi:aryl-alcohol dehydrogenase-like predicted oxidoreductase
LRQIDGTDVFPIGLGAMPMSLSGRPPEERSIRTIHAALDAGVNLIDTADAYSADDTDVGHNERLIAKALRGRRDGVVVATKGGHTRPGGGWELDGRPEHIRAACEASLRALETDRIDLYQYHRPDGVTPIEETLGALDELVREGLVRHVGSSNFDGRQVVEADELARERGWSRFVSAQNEYSLLERGAEEELLPTCERLGIGVLPYFPLASGLLTGKYRRGAPAPAGSRLVTRPERLTPDVFDRVEALERFAEERGASLLEVAIGGLAAQPAIASVIAGATKPEQVRANAAAGDWGPNEDDLEALNAL